MKGRPDTKISLCEFIGFADIQKDNKTLYENCGEENSHLNTTMPE